MRRYVQKYVTKLNIEEDYQVFDSLDLHLQYYNVFTYCDNDVQNAPIPNI
jgi:hypothetical protein